MESQHRRFTPISGDKTLADFSAGVLETHFPSLDWEAEPSPNFWRVFLTCFLALGIRPRGCPTPSLEAVRSRGLGPVTCLTLPSWERSIRSLFPGGLGERFTWRKTDKVSLLRVKHLGCFSSPLKGGNARNILLRVFWVLSGSREIARFRKPRPLTFSDSQDPNSFPETCSAGETLADFQNRPWESQSRFTSLKLEGPKFRA